MKISERTIKRLGEIITGDKALSPYRSGPKLVSFFNDFGTNHAYGQGFPLRWTFAEDCLRGFNDTPALRKSSWRRSIRFQRFGLHNLRHSPSNWLVNKAKVEPKTVQGILRHSKIQTTLDLYTQEDRDETLATQGEYLTALGVSSSFVQ